jgi:Flp pilus assembly protein TadG
MNRSIPLLFLPGWLRERLSSMSAGRSSSTRLTHRRSRGQALLEFVFVVPIMLVFAITIADMVPAINARGVVLDIGESATERVARYLPSYTGSGPEEQATLCNQILAIARNQISAVFGASAVAGSGASGCTEPDGSGRLTPNVGSANPVVWVAAVGDSGVAQDGLPLYNPAKPGSTVVPTTIVEVCVAYEWQPKTGLLWVFAHWPPGISTQLATVFTYHFCGRNAIAPYRAR